MTIVWLGSLGSTSAMWGPQLARFPGGVVVELPGHGDASEPHAQGEWSSIGALAHRVVATLDERRIDGADLVGLSIGGMIAMQLAAATAPDRVRRLVLLCTSARLGPATAWLERAAAVRRDGVGSIAPAVVGRWLTPGYAAGHAGEVARLEAMVASVGSEGYAQSCEAIAAMDLRPALARIAAPTLVVTGTDDPATPPAHGRAIAEAVPGARFAEVPGAHLASWECADPVNALIADHLDLGS